MWKRILAGADSPPEEEGGVFFAAEAKFFSSPCIRSASLFTSPGAENFRLSSLDLPFWAEVGFPPYTAGR